MDKMKVSKTVSIDLDLLQRTLQTNQNFSKIVSLALESYLFFKEETERGNSIFFSRNFTTKIPPSIVWRLLSFENMVKWVNLIDEVEYLSDQKLGEGVKCKLYGKISSRPVSSIAEIIEYRENERFVYRAEGDFTIVSSVTMRTSGSKSAINAIGVIGLSPSFASPELYKEISSNLESAFVLFEKVAKTIS